MAEDNAGRKAARIKIVKGGPYIVYGRVKLRRQEIISNEAGQALRWQDGEEIPVPDTYSLCRCGRTSRAPFCDGSHSEAGFSGEETAGHDPYIEEVELFEGPNLILTDKQRLCAGARFCDSYGGTWKLAMKSNDPKARAIAIQQTADCPSGRLVVYHRDSFEPIEPQLEREISIIEDPAAECSGPLWVKCGIPIESADGTVYETRNRVTLCRCGKSANMPFCDGSHVGHGFREKGGKYENKR